MKLIALAVCAASVAWSLPAFAIYKCTGADGKVTFQDAPCAAAAGGKTESIVVRPAAVPRRATTAASAAALPQASFEAAVPGLEMLHSTQLLVENFETVCGTILPAAKPRYGRVADTWRGRHAPLLEQLDAAFLRLTPDQHRKIVTESLATVARARQGTNARQDEGKLRKWCDESADEISAGKMDVHRDATVQQALKAIQPR